MKSLNFNRLMLFVFVAVAMTSLSSCSYRLVDFTVISSKNHSLNIDKTQGVRVIASSNGFLGIGASIKDAMDRALQSAGPDYDLLIDGVVRTNDYFFVTGYKVEGTAISSAKMKASLGIKEYEEWRSANNAFDYKDAIVKE